MIFVDYVYYRVASFYTKGTGEAPNTVLGVNEGPGAIAFNVATIFLLMVWEKESMLATMIFGYFPIRLFLFYHYRESTGKFHIFKERWRNEKHKKLKGWAVAIYVALSFILFIVTAFVIGFSQ